MLNDKGLARRDPLWGYGPIAWRWADEEGRHKAKRTTAMRRTRTEFTICTGLRNRGGISDQSLGD